MARLDELAGDDGRIKASLNGLKDMLRAPAALETRARQFVETLARTAAAALLRRQAPPASRTPLLTAGCRANFATPMAPARRGRTVRRSWSAHWPPDNPKSERKQALELAHCRAGFDEYRLPADRQAGKTASLALAYICGRSARCCGYRAEDRRTGYGKTFWKKFAAVTVAAGLGACSLAENERDEMAEQVYDRNWVVSQIEGVPAAPGVTSTLTIADDGKVSGNAGCNGYFGSVILDDSAMTFGNLGATRRAVRSRPWARKTECSARWTAPAVTAWSSRIWCCSTGPVT